MKDLKIVRDDHPGALAAMGEAPGRAGVSLEGGSARVGQQDGAAACSARETARIRLLEVDDVARGPAVSEAGASELTNRSNPGDKR